MSKISINMLCYGALTIVRKIRTFAGPGVNDESYFEDEVIETGGCSIKRERDDLFVRELVTL